jgi:hypothetical protein
LQAVHIHNWAVQEHDAKTIEVAQLFDLLFPPYPAAVPMLSLDI